MTDEFATTNQKFKQLLKDYKLKYKDAAEMMDVSYRCIQHWVALRGTEGYRQMRTHFLKLLEKELVQNITIKPPEHKDEI